MGSSLRHKLWLGFGGLLGILVIVSALTMIMLTRYSRTLERVFRENYDSAVFCDEMRSALNQLNLNLQFQLWQDPAAPKIDVSSQIARFQLNLNRELNNITLPGEGERADHLSDLWNTYQAQYRRFSSTPAKDRSNLYRRTILPLHEQMVETAGQIAQMNMSNMVSVDGQVKRTLVETRNALFVLVIAGVVAAGIVVGAAGRSILHPLSELTRSARRIEEGDLDSSLPVRGMDEIGQLAHAFNSMTVRLREFRKLDHERLLRTQQTTQLAIDSLPDAVFVFGPQGVVEVANQSARMHFAVEAGANIEQLGQRLKWLEPLYRTAREGQAQPELRGYQSALQLFENGEERFLLPRSLPMISAAGAVTGVIVILVDVTRLRAADEAKSNLVSTVSHELRTPLTSIRMALSMMATEKFAQPSPQRSTLTKAATEDAERLNRVIENLMSISRMESGRASFDLQPMPPGEIVSQAVDPLRPAFGQKQIELTVQVSPELPDVLADPGSIGSALTNLLSNALKFTPAGGRVTVSAEADTKMVAFIVCDTGAGIPAEYEAKIFDKFFRVPRSDGPSGAGLGLTIAREVVEAHGGVLEYCPGSGPGSTFRFTLQRSQLPAKMANLTPLAGNSS